MERTLDLNEELIRNKTATFFARAQRDSMRDAGIRSGDILVVDRSITPTDKQIVVAMIDGEFTVKRFRKWNGRITLEAENPSFAPIEVEEEQELIIGGGGDLCDSQSEVDLALAQITIFRKRMDQHQRKKKAASFWEAASTQF